jgi:hypothetical protein
MAGLKKEDVRVELDVPIPAQTRPEARKIPVN